MMDKQNEGGATLKRRELLMMVAGAGLALVLPVAALAGDAKWVSVGKASVFVKDQPMQIVLPNNGGTIWVTRTGKNKLTAVSAVCTHKGGIVNWDATAKKLICPLHAAGFAFDGKNLNGTRKSPDAKLANLPTVPVKEQKGEVQVDVSGLAPAPVPTPPPVPAPAPPAPKP